MADKATVTKHSKMHVPSRGSSERRGSNNIKRCIPQWKPGRNIHAQTRQRPQEGLLNALIGLIGPLSNVARTAQHPPTAPMIPQAGALARRLLRRSCQVHDKLLYRWSMGLVAKLGETLRAASKQYGPARRLQAPRGAFLPHVPARRHQEHHGRVWAAGRSGREASSNEARGSCCSSYVTTALEEVLRCYLGGPPPPRDPPEGSDRR